MSLVDEHETAAPSCLDRLGATRGGRDPHVCLAQPWLYGRRWLGATRRCREPDVCLAPAGRVRRRRPRRFGDFGDAGMVTAETAVVLPVLVFVLAAALAAVSVVTAQLRCTDAAREGARAAARGESEGAIAQIVASSAPEGSAVSVSEEGDTVTVEVSAAVALFPGLGPAMTVSDSATAALEPGLVRGQAALGPAPP